MLTSVLRPSSRRAAHRIPRTRLLHWRYGCLIRWCSNSLPFARAYHRRSHMSLESIALPQTGAVTTRLRFGCAGLLGGVAKTQSRALLDAAWGAGIRHFDTAPTYGDGASEALLGDFLRRRTNNFTVTTSTVCLAVVGRDWPRYRRRPRTISLDAEGCARG
jgi:Aldo/keto reductase family